MCKSFKKIECSHFPTGKKKKITSQNAFKIAILLIKYPQEKWLSEKFSELTNFKKTTFSIESKDFSKNVGALMYLPFETAIVIWINSFFFLQSFSMQKLIWGFYSNWNGALLLLKNLVQDINLTALSKIIKYIFNSHFSLM